MKIVLNERGLAVATAETVDESVELQTRFLVIGKKMGRPFGSKNVDKKKNSWGGKHRKVCQFCGKAVKNMKLHMLIKHTKEYKELYGDQTSNGKHIGDTYNWERGRK